MCGRIERGGNRYKRYRYERIYNFILVQLHDYCDKRQKQWQAEATNHNNHVIIHIKYYEDNNGEIYKYYYENLLYPK